MSRRLVGAGLLALSLTACGSRADFTALTVADGSGQPVLGEAPSAAPGTTGGLPSTAGTTAGGSTGATTAIGGSSGTVGTPGGTTGGATGATSGLVQGANKAPIRLAYIIQGSAGISAITGSNVGTADSDVAVRTMNALVKYANDHGGVGGRKISAQGFKSEATSQQAERLALCKQITEDYKAQVVLDQNQFSLEEGQACFAQHKVNFLGTISATDSVFLKKYAPYLTTTWLAEDRQITAAVNGGQAVGFFKGGKVGVLMMDNPTQHRLYDTQLKPALARIGVTDPQVRFLSEDPSAVSAQTNAAELAFATGQVDRIVFLANILVYLGFTNQAESQGYHPRYEFADFNSGTGVAAFYGSPSQNANSIGVSSSPSSVVDDDSQSSSDTTKPYDRKKASPATIRCLDILTKQTGVNYWDPNASGDTLATWVWYCDEFFAWWEAAQAVGAGWTPGALGKGLLTVKNYLSTMQHSASFASGRNDGASSYRVGRYTETCKCYVKATGWFPV